MRRAEPLGGLFTEELTDQFRPRPEHLGDPLAIPQFEPHRSVDLVKLQHPIKDPRVLDCARHPDVQLAHRDADGAVHELVHCGVQVRPAELLVSLALQPLCAALGVKTDHVQPLLRLPSVAELRQAPQPQHLPGQPQQQVLEAGPGHPVGRQQL